MYFYWDGMRIKRFRVFHTVNSRDFRIGFYWNKTIAGDITRYNYYFFIPIYTICFSYITRTNERTS